MQQFQLPTGGTFVKDSLPLLVASIRTVLSNNSGTSFPSSELQVGMGCFRTDQGAKGRFYVLSGYTTDTVPSPVWTMVYDFNLTATSKEYVDQQITTLTNSLNQGLTGAAYYSQLTGAAKLIPDDYTLAQSDAILPSGVNNVVVTAGTDTRLTLSSTLPRGNTRALQDEVKPDGMRRWRVAGTGAWSAWRTPVTTVNGVCSDFPSFYAVSPGNQAIRLREPGLANASNGTAWGNSPRMDFYWSGVVQTLVGIDALGNLQLQRIGYEAGPVTVITSGNLHTVQKLSYKAADYGLALSDLSGSYIRMGSASPMSLVVYTNAAAPIPIGTVITIRQVSTGQVSIVPASGVTIQSPETFRLRKAGSTAMLIKVDTDYWELSGDLELL